MRKKIITYLLLYKPYYFMLICLFQIKYISHAQQWTTYTSNSSTTMAQDRQGNLWVGSRGGGLARFDGNTWLVYTVDNSEILTNDVISLTIDREGNKWLGTSCGVSKFNGTIWTHYTSANSPLTHLPISVIAIDSTNNLWCGSLEGYIYRFTGSSWFTYTMPNNNITPNPVFSIAVDRDNNKWFTGYGIVKYDNSTWQRINADTTNDGYNLNNLISSIAIDSLGVKWLASYFNGIYKLQGLTFTSYNNINSPLLNNNVRAIQIDVHNNKWFGCATGLSKFDGIRWVNYPFPSLSTSNDLLNKLLIDNLGNKWISTHIKGLHKFDGTSLTNITIPNTKLPMYWVGNSVIDNQGNKWFECNGLLRYDGLQWTHIEYLDNQPIMAMFPDRQRNFWVVQSQRLGVFNGLSWRYIPLQDTINLRIYDIDVDNQNNVWVADALGIRMFDGVRWNRHHIVGGRLSSCHAIHIDNNSNVFALKDANIFKYNGSSWLNIDSTTYYYDIKIDDNNNIWVLGNNFLRKLNSNTTNHIEYTFDTIDVSPSSLNIDRFGNKWISTLRNGVYKLNDTIRLNYNITNSGIAANYVTNILFDGRDIWFGGVGLSKLTNAIVPRIERLAENGITIFPNPANSIITIESNITGIGNIIDINGQILLTFPTDIGRNDVNIRTLHNGVYFIQIGDNIARFIKM